MINIDNQEFLNGFTEIFKKMLTLTVEIIKEKNETESIQMISNLDELTLR